MRALISIGLLVVMTTDAQGQQGFAGRYAANTPTGPVVVTLGSADDGSMTGQFLYGGYVLNVVGAVEGSNLGGYLQSDMETLGFSAAKNGDILVFTLFGYDQFGQPNAATAQTLQLQPADEVDSGEPAQPVTTVTINRTELSTEKVNAIEARYGTRLPPGRYWYDAVCGAWGYEGGPTLGFVAPRLELPGPLPADVSGSGTGIFINGREIHAYDQMALIGILGVTYPGRYTLDASGNLSVEGGGFLVNLVQAANASQQQGKGGLYSGMGGTVGTDGSGGVLFYNRNASGGYNNYSN